MPLPDWTRTEDWEVVFLGKHRLPGVARVEVKIPSALDKHKPRGAKKARIRDVGAQPADVSIELELLPSEMAQLESVMNTLRPRAANGVQNALIIGHPMCRLYGVGTVKLGEVSSPHPGPGGAFLVKISATEHVDGPKKIKKPATKSETEDADSWNTDKIMSEWPSAMQRAQANFTSGVEPNFSSGDIPGSGF